MCIRDMAGLMINPRHLYFNFQMLTLFSIAFIKCVALSVHCSIEGDKILGKRKTTMSRQRPQYLHRK